VQLRSNHELQQREAGGRGELGAAVAQRVLQRAGVVHADAGGHGDGAKRRHRPGHRQQPGEQRVREEEDYLGGARAADGVVHRALRQRGQPDRQQRGCPRRRRRGRSVSAESCIDGRDEPVAEEGDGDVRRGDGVVRDGGAAREARLHRHQPGQVHRRHQCRLELRVDAHELSERI